MTTYSTHSTEQNKPTVAVWDILVRVFHWSLVGFFTFSYITGEHASSVHYWSGYAIVGLLVFRLVWGVIGPKHARFIDFVRPPKVVKQYLLALKSGNARRYLGHNPAGGIMVVTLLCGLLFMGFSGMLLAGLEGDGPFANTWLMSLDVLPIEDLHELVANLLVASVALHVAGVILSSRLHKENLVKSMITGRKIVKESKND
jgi:cytochrome b